MKVDSTGMGRVEIVNTNGLNTTVNGQLSGGPNAVNVTSASGDFATTGLAMGFQAGGATGSVGTSGKFFIGLRPERGHHHQWPDPDGQRHQLRPDRAGSGTTAGIVITLVDHSSLSASGGSFKIVQNRTPP